MIPPAFHHYCAVVCVWGPSAHHTGSDPVNKLRDEAREHVLVAATLVDWVNGSVFVQVVGTISELPSFIRVVPLIPFRGSVHNRLCRGFV